MTIVLTSHILAEIQQRVDRLALMREGRIQALGTVQALREAQDLPLSIRVVLRPSESSALRRWLAELTDRRIPVAVEGGVAEFAGPRGQKLALRAALTSADGLGALVADLEVHEPTLEDVFLGYAAQGAASTAGNAEVQP